MKTDAVQILGVRVDGFTLASLLFTIEKFVTSGATRRVMYANVYVLNTAYWNPELRRMLNDADIVYCDGGGVRLGARLLGKRLPIRMTGADWIYDLCELCQRRGFSLYLLGGKPGIPEAAREKLLSHYPDLKIAGVHDGYFDRRGPENDNVVAEINSLCPDILLAGFGTPLQEEWIDRNHQKLRVPVVWAVGAVMDFMSGQVPRAPLWMLDNGLEWLYRFWLEPRRMWRRYILGNPLFLWRVLLERFGFLNL